ncbi:isoleucine--tRNA ligase [Paenibacillus sp. J2TS4]|uniref:isoleucine--tRNA ligase n=1 Tax=Paenibacillus sp. J2TS4 TaxID=2807194 RepID=UPI001B187AC6|nr:isoleucine--tRNA ligase [Paenibacillus sp. J2TS4]GIP34771.1 isoleucine--tRNA ligase 2 [Paenibacillus sp. J2TS4]
MKPVDVRENARERERRILKEWADKGTFAKSTEAAADKRNFVFYEGPPTANGAPHIGHVLGRVIKDFIGRYKTMTGYRVIRKAGWDTHGLPVELGVEKQLGISGKQEIEHYGVAEFVRQCKSSVFEYEKQWRDLTEAIGYWTDLDNPYVTLTNDYIESVWYILSQIHHKGLLYRGHRVSPYCPSCQTSLSSHEVAQGYEDVKDLSATVKFVSKQSGDIFLAWTTTPWTLPANTALAVNPDLAYARVRQGEEVYIVAETLAEQVMNGDYEVLSVHSGAEFIGTAYQPPFAFAPLNKGHVVIGAEFVSDTSGTGIVHIAPAHGEDDYRACRHNNIDMLQVVDASGRYIEAVAPLAGRFVKDCDVDIVKDLAARNLLYSKERYEHSYPFCWRCHSPLLYYAMESWFIRTTAVKEQLIENNQNVRWYPEHLRDGRFGKFLEELIDWNISRNRYWGTPLNVWICRDCECEYTPESREDLRRRSVTPLDSEMELHKPYVDEVQLTCPQCAGVMERTPEVIDVWFDSGSMPFAQYHYPFGDKQQFAEQYPADMICEGIDQTRGWFFSLLAVSTLLNGQAPYKAVMSTGHILDENGQKMSKSKGNVINPWEIIEEFGADAFRWALLADSAPWNNKRFTKSLVAEAKSKVIDTLTNAHSFYVLYATIDDFRPEEHPEERPVHQLDRWILSRLNSTLKDTVRGLEGYDFLNPAKSIEAFIDELSNWYIRRSRDRYWGHGLTDDKISAYQTLRTVLLTVSRMIAPFAPFLAEDLYLNLNGGGESVHLAAFPAPEEAWISPELEQGIATARKIVELARSVRNDTGIKTRQPLSGLAVTLDFAFDLLPYEEMIREEINVKTVTLTGNHNEFVDQTVKLNWKLAGPKFGKLANDIQPYLQGLNPAQIQQGLEQGSFEWENGGTTMRVSLEELIVETRTKEGFAAASGSGITVTLDTRLTPELLQEGTVRELIRAVQDKRKKLQLPIDRRVRLLVHADAEGERAIRRFESVLQEGVLISELEFRRVEEMEEIHAGSGQIAFYIE